MATITPIVKGAGAVTRIGAVGVFRWIVAHWYIFLVILVLLPKMIGAVGVAIETKNPSYPLVHFGLSITNADALIQEDVDTLKKNPQELLMKKPSEGMWQKLKYRLNLLKLAWRFFGNIFLIALPFVSLYHLAKWRGKDGVQSSGAENVRFAIITGFLLILMINMILVIVKLSTGDLTLDLNQFNTIYDKVWHVFLLVLPFHGLISLIVYLTGPNVFSV